MHGLVNKAFQCFIRDTYGMAAWAAVARQAELDFDGFETLSDYDPRLTQRVLEAAVVVLDRPREVLLEDTGTYLVSHPNTQAVRRLLRFGGAGFLDFLLSLDELPDRARLALADLRLPQIDILEQGAGQFTLHVHTPLPGAGHVLVGLLRAMADDYGALAVMEHRGRGPFGEVIGLQLLDSGFAKGRQFDLASAGGGG
jgi:hypothetical protein